MGQPFCKLALNNGITCVNCNGGLGPGEVLNINETLQGPLGFHALSCRYVARRVVLPQAAGGLYSTMIILPRARHSSTVQCSKSYDGKNEFHLIASSLADAAALRNDIKRSQVEVRKRLGVA